MEMIIILTLNVFLRNRSKNSSILDIFSSSVTQIWKLLYLPSVSPCFNPFHCRCLFVTLGQAYCPECSPEVGQDRVTDYIAGKESYNTESLNQIGTTSQCNYSLITLVRKERQWTVNQLPETPGQDKGKGKKGVDKIL